MSIDPRARGQQHKMKTRLGTVTAQDGSGEIREATMFLCQECDGEMFIIYKVEEHQHIECVNCSTSYCDGKCGAARRQ